MFRWDKFIYAAKDYIILTVLLAISILFILNNNQPQINWIRSNVLNILGIWQNSISSVYQFRALKLENEILRERLALRSFENSMMQEALLERDRLYMLLDFKRKSQYDLITVKLISRYYQGFSHVFFIDIGEEDSVQPDMVVVSSEGLIGKIALPVNNGSLVQALDDLNFRASAIVQRSRVTGIIRPDVGGKLRLDYVPVISDVKEGDVVVTSGISDIFPKGIEIGYVSKIDTIRTEHFKVIHVEPSVDLTNVEEAFVIRNKQIGSQ